MELTNIIISLILKFKTNDIFYYRTGDGNKECMIDTTIYDKFQMKFYNKVQNGFIKISKKNQSNYLIINSNLDIKKNKEIVVKKLKRILNIR